MLLMAGDLAILGLPGPCAPPTPPADAVTGKEHLITTTTQLHTRQANKKKYSYIIVLNSYRYACHDTSQYNLNR